jgi:hypothetical protein
MRQVIVQLLAVIQQQTARIAAMEMLGISDEVRYNDLHHLSTMRT